MNGVFEVGNLTRDAELRYTNSGTPVCNITIAVNEKFKDEETTNFFDCVLWGKFAESMAQYLTKGKQVAVFGKLNNKKYEKDGETRYRTEITVKDLQLLGKKESEF